MFDCSTLLTSAANYIRPNAGDYRRRRGGREKRKRIEGRGVAGGGHGKGKKYMTYVQ